MICPLCGADFETTLGCDNSKCPAFDLLEAAESEMYEDWLNTKGYQILDDFV